MDSQNDDPLVESVLRRERTHVGAFRTLQFELVLEGRPDTFREVTIPSQAMSGHGHEAMSVRLHVGGTHRRMLKRGHQLGENAPQGGSSREKGSNDEGSSLDPTGEASPISDSLLLDTARIAFYSMYAAELERLGYSVDYFRKYLNKLRVYAQEAELHFSMKLENIEDSTGIVWPYSRSFPYAQCDQPISAPIGHPDVALGLRFLLDHYLRDHWLPRLGSTPRPDSRATDDAIFEVDMHLANLPDVETQDKLYKHEGAVLLRALDSWELARLRYEIARLVLDHSPHYEIGREKLKARSPEILFGKDRQIKIRIAKAFLAHRGKRPVVEQRPLSEEEVSKTGFLEYAGTLALGHDEGRRDKTYVRNFLRDHHGRLGLSKDFTIEELMERGRFWARKFECERPSGW